MRIVVKYELGHSYEEEWEATEFSCPSCGGRPVWHETGEGDYYVKESFLCVACGAAFHLPSGAGPSGNWQDLQRLEAIRNGVHA